MVVDWFTDFTRSTRIPALRIVVALHYGEVIYGNIGAAERLDFTVIGPAVNLVSRIEAVAKSLDLPLVVSDDFVAASAVESLSNEGWWGDNAEIFRFEVGTPYPSPSQRVNYLAIELTIDHVPDEDIGWPDPHRAVEQGIRKALEPYKFIHVGEIRSVATTGSAGDNLLLLTNEELTALTQLLAAEEHVFTSHNVLRAVLESITKETE